MNRLFCCIVFALISVFTCQTGIAQVPRENAIVLTVSFNQKVAGQQVDGTYHFCKGGIVVQTSKDWGTAVAEYQVVKGKKDRFKLNWIDGKYSALNGVEIIQFDASSNMQILNHTDRRQIKTIRSSTVRYATKSEGEQVARVIKRHNRAIEQWNDELDKLERQLGIYDGLSFRVHSFVAVLNRMQHIVAISNLKGALDIINSIQ